MQGYRIWSKTAVKRCFFSLWIFKKRSGQCTKYRLIDKWWRP